MNKYLPLLLLLCSCVSYSGNSVASHTVTSDIMKYIKLFEMSQNCNKIQAVHREPYASNPEKQEYEEIEFKEEKKTDVYENFGNKIELTPDDLDLPF